MFPLAANRVSGPQWSECARGGAAVKARRGDALLFYRSVPEPAPQSRSRFVDLPGCRGLCTRGHRIRLCHLLSRPSAGSPNKADFLCMSGMALNAS